MSPIPLSFRLAALAVPLLAGCGGAERAPETTEMPPFVRILSPANGDTVSLPVVVTLSATAVEVVPATGVAEPGKGHHHLVIGRDVPSATAPIPSEAGLVHLGSGAQTYTIDSLAPGTHRIIAVFASGDHVPMAGVRPDTIHVTVR